MQKEVIKEINKSSYVAIRKRNEGITLISLVTTIIILLILAGISITMLIGENGILTQANRAKEENKKAEYIDELDMIRLGLDVDRVKDGLSNKEFMDKYEEEIKKNDTFQDATVERRDEETIRIVTQEGYVYEVTVEGTEYLGQQGEEPPPDLQETDIELTMNPSTPTNGSVKVSIDTKINGYKIQYSTNEGETWNNYESEITITDNGVIYVRLINNLGETGGYTTGNIENIDRLPPNLFTASATSTTNSITLTGSTEDAVKTEIDGSSGIKAYYFSKDNGLTWEPENGQIETSYTFSNLTQNTPYQLKMKAVDYAENETETDTISENTGTVPGLVAGSNTTFTYTPSTPTKGNVSVSISTTVTGYTLQYSTNGTQWNNYTAAVTIANNGPIYARLIDSKGQAGGYATGNVTNIDKTGPTVTISASNITTTSAKVNVTASDSNGIASYQYYLGNTLKSTSTTNSYNFTGLASGTTYTLKVIVTDNVGNTTEKSTTVTTYKPISSLKAGNRVYYIDKSGTRRECIVLYDSSSTYGVQIITADSVGMVTLGSNDFNTAVNAYNSVITTLNTKANDYLNTTYASSARCVGSVPNNKNAESGYFTSSYSYMANYNGKLRDTDTNYETDYNQMGTLGIRDIDKSYWLASRNIISNSSSSSFYVRYVNPSGDMNGNLRFCHVYTNREFGFDASRGLRPVFTLKSGIMLTAGDGVNTPYTLVAP